MLQSLPPEIISHVLDYMTIAEACRLVKIDPRTIGDCVTLNHVVAKCNDGNTMHSCDRRIIGPIERSGRDFHAPSNQRLLRIISVLKHDEPVLCDLCHTKEATYFCWYWGLIKCHECMNYHEQWYEYEIERFGCAAENKLSPRKKGPRKYFVNWAGDKLFFDTKLWPLLSTGRLVTHGSGPGFIDDFRTICVLAEPAFDPYTREPCGPLITHKEIDQMDDWCSQTSIDALVAAVDANVNEDRTMQLMRLADELKRTARRDSPRRCMVGDDDPDTL
jgi:hypothetical protein